jgi:chondroitin 4-sulfotransferase 11
MLVSEKNKYIFIAVPKTATRSIEKYLLENDKSAKKNCVNVDGKLINVPEHITAFELNRIMGDAYKNFIKIGFARHPYSKIVSSYFFYKNGEALTPGNNSKTFETKLRIYAAKILPFKLWSILYPYKSNLNHLADNHNNVIVDYIGRYENLQNDLKSIFQKVGVVCNDEIPALNRSKHEKVENYYTSKLHEFFITRKVKTDLDFYNQMPRL